MIHLFKTCMITAFIRKRRLSTVWQILKFLRE
ncbi:Uncharacterised protein [Escherichia coli]|nr:Uncharacterised protein [Escherichia coli]STJ47163.1 Uncharacterised protein [Escherichia coli]